MVTMVSRTEVAPGGKALDILRPPSEERSAEAIREETGRHCGIWTFR